MDVKNEMTSEIKGGRMIFVVTPDTRKVNSRISTGAPPPWIKEKSD